MDRDTPDI